MVTTTAEERGMAPPGGELENIRLFFVYCKDINRNAALIYRLGR